MWLKPAEEFTVSISNVQSWGRLHMQCILRSQMVLQELGLYTRLRSTLFVWACISHGLFLAPILSSRSSYRLQLPICGEKRNLRNQNTKEPLFCFLKRSSLGSDFDSLIIRLNLYLEDMDSTIVPSKSGPTQQRGAVCFSSKLSVLSGTAAQFWRPVQNEILGPLLKVLLHRPHTPEALACVLFNQKKG